MDATEFLTTTIISGYVYDFLKQGLLATAKNVKDFFSDNLYELSNEQAREINSNIQKIDTSDIQILSKEEFINKYETFFIKNDSSINNINNTLNSTNAMNNMGSQHINGNIYIGSTPEKKTD